MLHLRLLNKTVLLTGIISCIPFVWSRSKIPSLSESSVKASPGIVWTVQASGVSDQLNSVIWTGPSAGSGTGQLVAVGDFGVIVTSPDGVAWTTQTSGTTYPLHSVVWTGSQLVAVGDGGTILTSTDGKIWTAQTSGTTFRLVSLKWAESAASTGSTHSTSSGQANSNQTSPTLAHGQLMAVGYNSEYNGAGIILTSPDGVTWTPRNPGTVFYPRSVTWIGSLKGSGAAQFVVIGGSETGRGIARNSQGTGKFVVMGGWSGKTVMLTSTDGVSWLTQNSETINELTALTWTGSQFVTVGPNGLIMTSPDGVTWTSRTSKTTNTLVSVSWTGPSAGSGTGQLVVGDILGNLLTSPDGVNWTEQASGSTPSPIFSATWTGARLVAVGDGGTILTSP